LVTIAVSAVSKAKITKSKSKPSRKKGSPLIRILEPDKVFLECLALERSQSMPEVLSSIIEKYKRQEFFDNIANAYADLRTNGDEWSQELQERKLYESTLADGLKDE
jgi:hypothetical protein